MVKDEPRPRRAPLPTLAPAAALLAALLIGRGADAHVIRHDVPDSLYIDYAAEPQFAGVGRLVAPGSGGGTATLVARRWLLTAAHVADDAPARDWTFTLQHRRHRIERIVVHPGWTGDLQGGSDVALMRLSAPIEGVPVTPLARTRIAVGGRVTMLGCGATGDGRSGVTRADWRRRAATNTVAGHLDEFLLMYFDGPGSGHETPLEAMAAYGDSGGPVFVRAGGGWRLAGLHAFVLDWNDTGVVGDYGDLHGAARIDRFAPWIEREIGLCPGDLDGNGTVDVADLVRVVVDWGRCGDPRVSACPADLDDSLVVGFDDLLAVVRAWGACP